MENFLEKLMYSSRWIMAPIYLGLSLCLLALGIKFFQEVFHILPIIFSMKEVELILYSTSNLIDYVIGKKTNSSNENLAYVSINQSIDAITQSGILNFDEIKTIIDNKKRL